MVVRVIYVVAMCLNFLSRWLPGSCYAFAWAGSCYVVARVFWGVAKKIPYSC